MIKHTPGPWMITETDYGPHEIVPASDKELDICRLPNWDDKWKEEEWANARLIAAAPELLEALKAVQIAATTPVLLDGEGKDMTVDAALSLVDAAIAKAEGKDEVATD